MPESKYAGLCLKCPLTDCREWSRFCLVRVARREDRRLTARKQNERRRLMRSRPRRSVKTNADTLRVTLAQAAYYEAVKQAGRGV